MKKDINLFFEKLERIKNFFKSDPTLDSEAKNTLIDSFTFKRNNKSYQSNDSLFIEFVLNYKSDNFSIFFINLYNEEDFKEDKKYLYIGNDGGSDGNLCIDKKSGEVVIFDKINNFKIANCYFGIDEFLLKLLDSYIFFIECTEEYVLENIDKFLLDNIHSKFRDYFKLLITSNYD